MIKRCILHILEHGTIPAVALALAIAPTNSRSWQKTRFHRTYKASDKNTVSGAEGRNDDLGDERPRARLSFYGGSTPN
jgi:hypothetical protein